MMLVIVPVFLMMHAIVPVTVPVIALAYAIVPVIAPVTVPVFQEALDNY